MMRAASRKCSKLLHRTLPIRLKNHAGQAGQLGKSSFLAVAKLVIIHPSKLYKRKDSGRENPDILSIGLVLPS
jgi:hypothetical protein